MRPRKLAPDCDIVGFLKTLDPGRRLAAIELLGEEQREALDRDWRGWAHKGQLAPPGDWATWVIKAGRGFGKTLAGAQWLTALIAAHETTPLQIALVGATVDDARRVMVEGNSGLIAVAGRWIDEWTPSMRRLRFRTGAEAVLFSGHAPDMLRGPEHHCAWCDELAKWEKPRETWDMLQLGLRLGPLPRAVITTTPRTGALLREIIADRDTVVTGGSTRANPHTSPAYKRRVESLYAGTRLGRQELEGELLPDAAGALWTEKLLGRCRATPGDSLLTVPVPSAASGDTVFGVPVPRVRQAGTPNRVSPVQSEGTPNTVSPSAFPATLIGVDPPSGDGTCGIIACARDAAGIGHVLADHSVTGRSPEGWARAVAAAASAHGRPGVPAPIVAESNQGGKMVRSVLHTADPSLRVKLATATKGKSLRAEPVAHLFEAGRVVLHGEFPELEAELLGMIAGGGYEGPGVSPDRADAMVWALSELMLREEPAPRVRALG